MLELIGTCVGNPFGDVNTLIDIIDHSQQITRDQFLRKCDVSGEDMRKHRDFMFSFPNDYTYHKGVWKGKPVYFFEHSRIEHFFM